MLLGTLCITKGFELWGKSKQERGKSIAYFLVGAALFFIGPFWSVVQPIVGSRLAESTVSLASNAWAWLLVFLVVWGHRAVLSILAVHKLTTVVLHDLESIDAALVMYVYPRELSGFHIDQIAEHLRKTTPREVALQYVANDNESTGFQADIRRAIERGGWSVKSTRPVEDAQEGLRINYRAPADHVDNEGIPPPDQILSKALRDTGSWFPAEVVGPLMSKAS